MDEKTLLTLPKVPALTGKASLYAIQNGTDYRVEVDQLPNNFVQTDYNSGKWYLPPIRGLVGSGLTLQPNSLRMLPFLLPKSVTVTDLAVRVTTIASGGNVQAAIYASDPDTNRPTGAALIHTGNLSTAATATVAGGLTAPVVLQPGLYYMVINSDATAGGTAALLAMNAASPHSSSLIGSASLNNVLVGVGAANIFLTTAATFGTWPDVTLATFAENATTSFGLVAMKMA